jgi:hypothetical protein
MKISKQDLANLFVEKCEAINARPLFAVLSGSHAHGYDTATSDYDLRGVYLGDPLEVLGFGLRKEHLTGKDGDIDYQFFELEKFLKMLVKPNLNMVNIAFNEKECFFGDRDRKNIAVIAELALSRQLIPQIDGVVHSCKKLGKKRLNFLGFQFLRGAYFLRSGIFRVHVDEIINDCQQKGYPDILAACDIFKDIFQDGKLGLTDAFYMNSESLWEGEKEAPSRIAEKSNLMARRAAESWLLSRRLSMLDAQRNI